MFQDGTVTFPVAMEFILPEFTVGLWNLKKAAVVVGMPKAPVDENHCIISWQHQVGPTRVAPVANPEPESGPVQSRPDLLLGNRILGANARHNLVPLHRSQNVHGESIHALG